MGYKDDMKQAMKRRRKRERDIRTEQYRGKRQRVMTQWRRSCDGCTACCEVLGVEELKKQYYQPCSHCVNQGCGIYNIRPRSCRNYYCLYLAGLTAGRPDKYGVLYFLTRGTLIGNHTTLEIYETREDAFLMRFRECLLMAGYLTSIGIDVPYILFVRFGFPIPTAWGGQTYQVKHINLGPPNIRYTIRSEHEAEDTEWWNALLDKLVREEEAKVDSSNTCEPPLVAAQDSLRPTVEIGHPHTAAWTGQLPQCQSVDSVS